MVRRSSVLVSSRVLVGLVCGLGLAVAACGGSAPPPVPPTTEAPAPSAAPASSAELPRRDKPAAGPAKPFAPPVVQERVLANGLRLRITSRKDLPLVAVRLAFARGAVDGAPGAAALTAELLRGGTKKLSALALDEAFADLGTEVSTYATDEGLVVGVTATSDKLPRLFELAADMVMTPALPDAELARAKKKIASALAAERADPDRLLSLAVRRALYGDKHPFGTSVYGTDEAVAAFTRRDAVAFLQANVAPADATLVVVGAVDADAVEAAARKAFGSWKGAPSKNAPTKVADVAGPRIVVLDRPGATQSHVAAADVGLTRGNPDYYAVRVLGMVLGGQFTSRLNMNLREKHAYTYGARARFDMGRESGSFYAGGAIVKEKTAPALKEIALEIERLRTEPITDDELALAKTAIVLPYAAAFETVERTAAVLADQAILGLPVDEVAALPKRIEAVTKDDVLRVAKAYLRPDKLRFVLVGDAKVLKESLEGLGLGPVEVQAPKPAKPATGAPATGAPATKAPATVKPGAP